MDDKEFTTAGGFSAEKRELLQALLLEEGISLEQDQSISQQERPVHIPLSFAQQRLWFMDRWEPESSLYNEPIVLQIQGNVHMAILEACFQEIIRRHEILRTIFVQVDEQPFQLILPSLSIPLELCDLSTLTGARQGQEVRELLREDGRRSFSLTTGPLLRIKLFRLRSEEALLSLTMHHIIIDGWSLSILLSELSALYQAYSQGQFSPLPTLAIQYADYACWQRDWLQGERLQEQLSYWQQQLAALPEQLKLPADYPRPAIQQHRGAISEFSLPAELTERLYALCQREGVTLFMLLLAAFQILLYRYSGQEDVIVGSPIANRTHQEIEPLLGFFANTLVLRSRAMAQSSLRTFLQQVRAVTLEAYAHQDIPFEMLVEKLSPARNLSFHPLFQIMFNLRTSSSLTHSLGSAKSTFLENYAERSSSKFDLTLEVREDKAGLAGLWEYDVDLFKNATIERISTHFQHILQNFVQNIEQSVYYFPMLTQTEQLERAGWNTIAQVYRQRSLLLHELIEAQAEHRPDAIAVCFNEQALSYRVLNERANQLARWLCRQGIGPEKRVGICLERSLDLPICLLAVLKAGGAYVPLDPELPQERLHYLLNDAQSALLITQAVLCHRFAVVERPMLSVEQSWEQLERESQSNLAVSMSSENLAYVIYTSGSTGLPKGAMNCHQGVVNRLLWIQETYQLQPADRILQKAPSSFDVSVTELFWPLFSGAQLIMARPEGQRDAFYIVDTIVREEITVVEFVPSMLGIFLEVEGVERCRSLRLLLSGGETLSVEMQRRCHERFQTIPLYNLYGPTETAVGVTMWPCVYEEHEGEQAMSVPIGRPIANLQAHILDTCMQPVPSGVPGELYIGGIGVGRGYLFRPALTAERFVPDPFSEHPGARLYRTGDLTYFRSDGAIEYIGRTDTQVKIRGYRIELGEIEAILGQHKAIRGCAVIAQNDRLIGYVELHAQNSQSTTKDLLQWLQDRLPGYMIPARLVILEALPFTPSGKLDRRALPVLEEVEPIRDQPFAEPRTPAEERVATIWQAVLGIKRISIFDDFFELGGHSLLATQVVVRVEKAFHVDIPLRTIFEKSIFAEFVEFVCQAQQERWQELLARLDTLSEEEVETLLRESSER